MTELLLIAFMVGGVGALVGVAHVLKVVIDRDAEKRFGPTGFDRHIGS